MAFSGKLCVALVLHCTQPGLEVEQKPNFDSRDHVKTKLYGGLKMGNNNYTHIGTTEKRRLNLGYPIPHIAVLLARASTGIPAW